MATIYQELVSIKAASQVIIDRCEKAISKLEPKKEKTQKDFSKVLEDRKKMRERQDRKYQNL